MSRSVQMIHINMSIKGAWAPFSDSMAELIQVMTQSRIRKTDVKPWGKKQNNHQPGSEHGQESETKNMGTQCSRKGAREGQRH